MLVGPPLAAAAFAPNTRTIQQRFPLQQQSRCHFEHYYRNHITPRIQLKVLPEIIQDAVQSGSIDLIAPTTAIIASSSPDADYQPFQYAFMFPVTTVVAVLCQSAGIGGAALLSPILLLIFPLLGPQYPINGGAASSIASALLTECFGFLSGLSGFWRRGLVDWKVAGLFLWLSVPAALMGAVVAPSLATETTLLRGMYATLMIGLCVYLVVAEKPDAIPDDCPVPEVDEELLGSDPLKMFRTKQATDGTIYTYLEPAQPFSSMKNFKTNWKSSSATLGGGIMTGLLGVGMGEVVLPQLVRLACMPIPVAAGTSVAIVVCTALTAACIQFLGLANGLMTTSSNTSLDISLSLGEALTQVIPWSLVQYTIPGAILGGQIAPWLAANRILDDDVVEQAVVVLFGIIGAAFAVKAVMG